jgi:lysophospholipase L1-like esterase
MPGYKSSRRNFLKVSTAGALSALIIPDSFKTQNSDVSDISGTDNKGINILFQGDSITDGNRGRDYRDLNHIMGHGYAFSIASRLGYEYPERNLRFFNRGISGNKVTDLADRWKTDTLDLHPDVLSILIGINDTSSNIGNNQGKRVTVHDFNDIYRSLLDQAISQNPEIILVLNQPFIFRNPSAEANWEEQHNDLDERQKIVEKISSDYNAIFVRLQDVFDSECKRAPAEYWIWDGIHPTVAGHEIIAREWIRQVGKRMKFGGNN